MSIRSHETVITIDAPIEEVWRALTSAERIQRWFAPNMRVEPRTGGAYVSDWGPGLEWKNVIEVWEPNRHLRLTETRDRVLSASSVQEPLEPCRLIQDFYLETAAGGSTVVRLVHSGFGSSEAWDREYEGTKGGWASCFVRLKHAVEHANESVHNRILTAQCDGLDAATVKHHIQDATAGYERVREGLYEFSIVIPECNRSIVSVSVQPTATGCVAYIELLLFGLDDVAASEEESRWRKVLDGTPTRVTTGAK